MKTKYHSDGELMPVAIRCYLETPPKPNKKTGSKFSRRKRIRVNSRPLRMMIVDVETLTQATLDNPDLMPGFDPADWNAPAMPLFIRMRSFVD